MQEHTDLSDAVVVQVEILQRCVHGGVRACRAETSLTRLQSHRKLFYTTGQQMLGWKRCRYRGQHLQTEWQTVRSWIDSAAPACHEKHSRLSPAAFIRQQTGNCDYGANTVNIPPKIRSSSGFWGVWDHHVHLELQGAGQNPCYGCWVA